MKGTEKQIRWANKIIEEKIAEARRSYQAYADQATISPEQVMNIFEAAAGRLIAAHDDASWWIDNRHQSVLGEIDAIADEIYKATEATEATEATDATEATETTWEAYEQREEEAEREYRELIARGEIIDHSPEGIERYERAMYQDIVARMDAKGGPKVKPKMVPWFRGEVDDSEVSLYREATEWLASHPEA
jgi:hypothetical protein